MQCATTHRSSVEMRDLLFCKFFSWSGETITDDHGGMIAELERLGEEVALADGLGESPLRPISPLTRLYGADQAKLISVSIQVYDVTLSGSSEQPGSANASIQNALDPSNPAFSIVDAYMASRFRNSVVGGWQPNFCRPRILINGNAAVFNDFLGGVDYPVADRSIGLDLPWCGELNYRTRRVESLQVFCPCGQIVGSVIKRYAVSLEMMWDLTNIEIVQNGNAK